MTDIKDFRDDMTFELPLNSRKTAKLTLPKTLTPQEAKKLKSFIDLLVEYSEVEVEED